MTKEEILNLRPKFKINQFPIIEWYEITSMDSFCFIRSGLNHADGVTKSPYYYENCIIGDNAEQRAIEEFSQWWDLL